MLPSIHRLLRHSIVLGLFYLLGTDAIAAEKKVVVLSSSRSVFHESLNLSDEVSSEISKRWQMELRTLHGGMQEGVQLLSVSNGALRIVFVLNRGMSILQVEDVSSGKRIFGWDSPVKEVVNPQYIDLESRGGLGWLYGFNEWMVRCGLEFAGHPGLDVLRSNTGESKELDLTLHGRIGNLPASEVEVFIDQQAPYQMRVRGVVEERMFYGPQLRLVSELVVLPNQRTFQLNETIENLSATEQEYQIIYHTNYGKPLLEGGAKVVLAAKSVSPMNQHAADSIGDYDSYQSPKLGFTEQVYLVEPWQDEKGNTAAVLHNRDKSQGAMMSWSVGTLPYLTIWKNTADLADGYVTGIEPGSGYPFNRRIERHFDRVPKLKAGEVRKFSLTYESLADSNAVLTALDRVEKIRAGRETKIIREVPKLPIFDE